MEKLLRSILPEFITGPLFRQINVPSAMKEHRRLVRSGLNVELQEKHIQNLKVLPNRDVLLEMLPKGGVMAEIGVAEGNYSQKIIDICQPDQLHLIDYWSSVRPQYCEQGYQHVLSRFSQQISDDQIVIHRGLSWEMIKLIPDIHLDWVYIDAGHSYDDVKKDLLAIYPKMKPEGIISGHDYIKWLNPAYRFGVVEAVNEFCIIYNFEMIYLTLESHMHLSYALRKIV